MNDSLLRLLKDLPSVSLDPSRTDRIRARCHVALAHRRQRDARRQPGYVRSWPPIAVGVVYVTQVVRELLTAYGVF